MGDLMSASRHGLISVTDAFRQTRTALDGAGIDTAALDARLLVCQAAEISHASFIADPDHLLSQDERAALAALLARRCDHQPLAQILGQKEFWGRSFAVTPDVLIPRPDSETLVTAALEQASRWRQSRPADELRILDLGTGSGCLLLTLLAELGAGFGVGVDRSPAALDIARANARRHGLGANTAFFCGNWAQSLSGTFDLIVANPPYIATAQIATLAPEVGVHEPHGALDGGADGLDAFRALLPGLDALTGPGSVVVMEFGAGQADGVAGLLRDEGLAGTDDEIFFSRDLTGRRRCVVVAMAGIVHLDCKKGLEKQRGGVTFPSEIRGERGLRNSLLER